MLTKAPGDVGCAHCKGAGAARDCAACGLLVCAACAADWRTCSLPRARTMRLGLTGRLRAVDADGCMGLVSYWHRSMRLVDLARARFVTPRARLHHHELDQACITRDGVVFSARYRRHSGHPNRLRTYAGLDVTWLLAGPEPWHIIAETDVQAGAFHLSRSERWMWLVRSDELIQIIDHGRRHTFTVRPLAREVVQQAYIDDESGVVAVGTYGRVDVFRLDGRALARRGSVSIPNADIRWLSASRHHVAVISDQRGPEGTELQVFALDSSLAPVRPAAHRWVPQDAVRLQGPVTADMSADGRFVVVALADRRLAALDLARGVVQYMAGHTDDISLVHLARGGRLLVSGDYDNRVFLRPHDGEGFARTVIEHIIPRAPVDSATLLP